MNRWFSVSSRSLRVFLASAPLAAATGCNSAPTNVESPHASVLAASASATPAPAPPPECVASVCTDEATLAVCADGKSTTKSCGADELCAGASCVAVKDVDGASVPRGRARRALGDGFLNAWSTLTTVPLLAAQKFLSEGNVEGVGGAKAFKATCAPDGYVQPRKSAAERNGGNILSIGAATVFVEKGRKLVLAVGSSGKLTVAINGKTVVEHAEAKGIGKRAWADEQSVEVELPSGASRVAVILDAPKTPDRVGGFFLRFRETNGAPAEGLVAMEAFEGAACAASELVDLSAKVDIDADGMFVTTAPLFRQLVPSVHDAKLALALTGKAPTTAEVSLVTPLAPVRIAPEGSAELSIKDGDRSLFSVKLPAPPALVSRVAALVSGLGDVKAMPSGGQASFENHVRYLVKLLTSGDDDTSFLEKHTQRAEEILAAARAGTDPYAERTGVVYRAYRSKVDGRLQPYVMYVPPSYLKQEKLPVVIMSHGRNRSPELGLRTLIGQAPDEKMTLKWASRNWPAFPDQKAILVSVYGFDEGASHPLGEEDMLDVIAELQREYRVDAQKISLTGFSLGGTVAFFLPMHYPDVFSATSPFCGYPNLLAFQNVAGVKRAPWEDAMLAKRYIVNYAENGQYVPVHVVHGGLDGPERSQVFVDRYREVGNTALFDVQDDLNHDVWDYGYKDGRMVHWLSKKTRPESPKRVRFVTGEYQYDHSYWVRVVAMHDSTSATRALVDAKLEEKEAKLVVKTENVDAFDIDRKRLAPTNVFQGAVTLTIDGAEIALAAGDGTIHLVRDAKSGAWATSESAPTREHMKRHGVSGPLADVLRHAIVVVYGTKDPAHTSANRMTAETLAANGGGPDIEWPVTARLPVISDVEATDAAIADKSVILIGSPSDNALTARWADALPVKFAGGAIQIRDKKHAGKGVGVSFIAPRPDDADEYVVVHAGLDVDGTLAARSLPRFLPDFVVYDAGVNVERGSLLFDDRPWIDGGFFDEHWE